MNASIIIPTLNRPEYLEKLLADIFSGTLLPEEILIIEQGDVAATKQLAAKYENRGVRLRILFESEKSLPVARNTGVRESKGDVLFFFDDDMSVGVRYLEIALLYLETHPGALGVTGSYMKREKGWTLKRLIGVLFCVFSFKSRNIVLASGANDYIRGTNLQYEQTVEWLYGGNMVLRKEVFNHGFQFNSRFKRWGFGEDVMLTYQLHKAFPGSLRYLPGLEIGHMSAISNKILNAEALRMKVIYRYVFWRREVFKGGILQALMYIWSQVGLSGLELMQHPSKYTAHELVSSYWYLFKNHAVIATESIDYNQFIFRAP